MSSITEMKGTIELFYSYAPEDETLEKELEKQLSLLQKQGVISGWHNRLMAGLYHSQSMLPEAELLYIRALAIREKGLAGDHPDIATSLNNLASTYKEQGRYIEAEDLYTHALRIWGNILGSDHPDAATGFNNLAGLYKEQGK